jgi:hypothetical protein
VSDLEHFHRQHSGLGLYQPPCRGSGDPFEAGSRIGFRYDLLLDPTPPTVRCDQDKPEHVHDDARVRVQLLRIEPIQTERPFDHIVRISALPQTLADTASLRMCRGREEKDVLTRLDQLVGQAASGLPSLFLIHRADGQDGIMYKSRQCETVFRPPEIVDGSEAYLCGSCRTFFRQLFGVESDELPSDVVGRDSIRDNLSGCDAQGNGKETQKLPGTLPVPIPVLEDKSKVEMNSDESALKEQVSLCDWGWEKSGKRKRPSKLLSCSECCLKFRSSRAFKRHLRVWHFASADSFDSGAAAVGVGTKPATIAKSCPYCAEVFPVGRYRYRYFPYAYR